MSGMWSVGSGTANFANWDLRKTLHGPIATVSSTINN